MSRCARRGALAVVAVLGVLVAGPEAGAFERDRGFQTCFRFDLGPPFGEVDAVLQLAGDRGRSMQILGVLRFEDPARPSLPVDGVARRRADGDIEVAFGLTVILGFQVRLDLAGRLVAPHFDSGPGGFVAVTGAGASDGPLTFVAITCPTTFGDFS